MSSWVIDTYTKDNIYAEYRWDKINGFETIVSHKVNGIAVNDYHNIHSTEDKAREDFLRQVRKIKKC